MPFSKYETKHYAEDGRLYVVVTLEDGSTFGQYITPAIQEEMDAEVEGHVSRYERLREPAPEIAIGAVRTKTDIDAEKIEQEPKA